jgi:hypothetical protein
VQRLSALRRLSGERRRALIEALCVVAAIRAGLSTIGFTRLRRLLGPVLEVRGAPVPGAPARVRWAVARAARPVPGATCLTQALAAQVLLARAGHASSLRMGARRRNGVLEAHAWLEDGERVVYGARGDFAALPPIEPLLRGGAEGGLKPAASRANDPLPGVNAGVSGRGGVNAGVSRCGELGGRTTKARGFHVLILAGRRMRRRGSARR